MKQIYTKTGDEGMTSLRDGVNMLFKAIDDYLA